MVAELSYSQAVEVAQKVPGNPDWRTVRRVARGERVRGRVALRIAEVLKELGLLSESQKEAA